MPDSPHPAPHQVSTPEVILVFPVYNEGEVIAKVTDEWLKVLDGLAISYRLCLCNDGSTDNTQEVLDGLSHPSLEIQHAKNRGHGPTILRAYRAAAERAAWVFQCDSDGEVPAEAFPEFWKKRHEADLVIGTRQNRKDVWIRALITKTLRFVNLCLFGKGITDVNCPYRLMRSDAFRPLFDSAPEDTFAPNVLISAFAVRNRLRIQTLPVEHICRQTGKVSIQGWSLVRAVVKATRQTLSYRFFGKV
jgi:glycosyltransferase involved in cell wall biosynthesis